MELLGLTEKRNTQYKTISGGQKQRLAIALALVGNPKVAILDELTTGLDPQARRDTWSLVERVRDTGDPPCHAVHGRSGARKRARYSSPVPCAPAGRLNQVLWSRRDSMPIRAALPIDRSTSGRFNSIDSHRVKTATA